MSELTFLERLLDGTEVEWKTLKEVAEYSKSRISFEKLDDTNYVGVDNLLPNKEGKSSSSYVPKTGLLTKYCINDILIGNIRPYLRKIWHANQSGGTNGDVLVIHPTDKKINFRYLYHVLAAESFFEYNIQHSKGAKMPRGNKAKIMEYVLPIPKPEVQTEIVRILDTFTSLTTELITELSARKKQYNYYRDQLLSFEEGEFEWKTLGDGGFFEVGSGGTPSKSKSEYWVNGTIPWLKSESCNNKPVYSANNFITELGLNKSSAKQLQEKTTLIALVGATIFKTAFLEFTATTNQNIASIKSKNSKVIKDKFIFYYITNLYEVLKSEMRNYGMLNLTTLRQFRIPVPPPEEQERIVAILDKFDTLTHSISEGLPREIKLRQQQYEYYRDLLLSFPKPKEVA